MSLVGGRHRTAGPWPERVGDRSLGSVGRGDLNWRSNSCTWRGDAGSNWRGNPDTWRGNPRNWRGNSGGVRYTLAL